MSILKKITDQNGVIKTFEEIKNNQNAISLSDTLKEIFTYIKDELFEKRIEIIDKLYNLVEIEPLLIPIKIKHAREINDKIFKDFSEVKNFKFYSEDENILKELSFILFSFGAGKNFYLTKDNLIDNIPRIKEFLESKLNNKIDIDEFCVIIDTIGKFIPGLNRQVSVKCRIPASNIYNFLISIKDKYIKLIMEEDNLKEKVKKVYEVIDKIDFLYEKSTVNMKLNLSLMLADQILSKIDDGIIITDKSNKINSLNDGLCRMLDIPDDDIKNILNEKTWPLPGLIKISDTEYEFTSGKTKKFLISEKIDLKREDLYVLKLMDVTEKTKAERERDAILKSSPDGIFIMKVIKNKNNEIVDLKYEKCHGNKNIFDEPEEEIIGKTIKERLGFEIANLIERKSEKVLLEGVAEIVEYFYKGKYFELTIGTHYLDNTIIIFKKDITTSKNAEKEKLAREKSDSTKKGIIGACHSMLREIDKFTAEHYEKVAEISKAIGIELGYSGDSLEQLEIYGKMHDIDKIKTPLKILNKSGKSKNIEIDQTHDHVNKSGLILQSLNFDKSSPSREIVAQYHERTDNPGYHLGFKEDDITLESQIIAIADIIDTMGRDRPYKKVKGLKITIDTLKNEGKDKYNPKIIEVVSKLYESGWFKEKGFKE